MSKRRRRRKKRGHYCWCCGRNRPNEKFTGRGHARHLCRDCAKLGKDELEYRQHVRDIDRLLSWDGLVRRKQRASFERYLNHPNERVRAYAIEVQARDRRLRQEFRDTMMADEMEVEKMAALYDTGSDDVNQDMDDNDWEDDGMPF